MEGVLEEMDVALQGAIQKDFSKISKDEAGGSRTDTY
jgi:hypothetical protein